MLIQNAELLTPVAQNWHNFFRCYEEMAENRRKHGEFSDTPRKEYLFYGQAIVRKIEII